MVELWVNDNLVELQDLDFSITKQIGDLFDIQRVKSSYTNSFSVPKTSRNTAIFQGLGLVGSTSNLPYVKVNVDLKYYGYTLIKNGTLSITETSDSYKVNILEGINDFLKDIENKTIGGNIDLSYVDHIKNMTNVLASFTNPNYRYIIADYGGKIYGTDTQRINIDYLIPSINISNLWSRIFSTFGWSYEGDIFSNQDFLNAWLTFPKSDTEATYSPAFQGGNEETFNNTKYSLPGSYGGFKYFRKPNDFDETFLTPNVSYTPPASNTDVGYVTILQTGVYNIQFKAKGFVRNSSGSQRSLWVAIQAGDELWIQDAGVDSEYIFNEDRLLNAGDKIFIRYATEYAYTLGLTLYYSELKLQKKDSLEMSFTDNLLDYQIKDFIKEIIVRFGLTPIIDSDRKRIKFLTATERFETSDVVDWSSKYVRRVKESYSFNTYAQVNYIKHKYNKENQTFNDGKLNINNYNLESSKSLYESKIYSSDQGLIRFDFHEIVTPVYPFYEKNIKETNDGEIEIEYKGLSSRFYIMKSELLETTGINFISEANEEFGSATDIQIASQIRTHYTELVPIYYDRYSFILNDAKIIEVELALNLIDIVNLDLSKRYYLEQEAGYFVLNKLPYKKGKKVIGEFILINK